MKWKKFTLETTTQAEDFISSLLADIGIEGVEIEDRVPLSEADTKGMFIDILPDPGPDDGTAKVSFYLEETGEADSILAQVRKGLSALSAFVDIGSGRLLVSETEDSDWINNWKQYFKPFCVDDIVIRPTWEETAGEDKDKLVIQIDPGMAFGTGQHETTQLCIRKLRESVRPGMRVLDVGTGSGILGITAVRLGAASVFGTDLDGNAIRAVYENLEANSIPPERFVTALGNIIDDAAVQEAAGFGCYDIAVANILAPVIIELQKMIARHLKPGGLFIASGIIDTKEKEVREALLANPELAIVDFARQNDWVMFAARKKA